MPTYNPTIHDPITISLQEYEFLQAYTKIESETFGNAYKSALKAGYSHWYARVITKRLTRKKLCELKKLYNSPLGKSLLKMVRDSQNDVTMLSYSKWKRMSYNDRKYADQVLIETEMLFGTPE